MAAHFAAAATAGPSGIKEEERRRIVVPCKQHEEDGMLAFEAMNDAVHELLSATSGVLLDFDGGCLSLEHYSNAIYLLQSLLELSRAAPVKLTNGTLHLAYSPASSTAMGTLIITGACTMSDMHVVLSSSAGCVLQVDGELQLERCKVRNVRRGGPGLADHRSVLWTSAGGLITARDTEFSLCSGAFVRLGPLGSAVFEGCALQLAGVLPFQVFTVHNESRLTMRKTTVSMHAETAVANHVLPMSLIEALGHSKVVLQEVCVQGCITRPSPPDIRTGGSGSNRQGSGSATGSVSGSGGGRSGSSSIASPHPRTYAIVSTGYSQLVARDCTWAVKTDPGRPVLVRGVWDVDESNITLQRMTMQHVWQGMELGRGGNLLATNCYLYGRNGSTGRSEGQAKRSALLINGSARLERCQLSGFDVACTVESASRKPAKAELRGCTIAACMHGVHVSGEHASAIMEGCAVLAAWSGSIWPPPVCTGAEKGAGLSIRKSRLSIKTAGTQGACVRVLQHAHVDVDDSLLEVWGSADCFMLDGGGPVSARNCLLRASASACPSDLPAGKHHHHSSAASLFSGGCTVKLVGCELQGLNSVATVPASGPSSSVVLEGCAVLGASSTMAPSSSTSTMDAVVLSDRKPSATGSGGRALGPVNYFMTRCYAPGDASLGIQAATGTPGCLVPTPLEDIRDLSCSMHEPASSAAEALGRQPGAAPAVPDRPRVCVVCARLPAAPRTQHFLCVGCKGVRYCGEACRDAHWRQHRLQCRQAARGQAAAGDGHEGAGDAAAEDGAAGGSRS